MKTQMLKAFRVSTSRQYGRTGIWTAALVIFLFGLIIPPAGQARTVQVMYGKLMPFMYQQKGKPAGFYVELMNMVLKEMGPVTLHYTYLPVKRGIEEVKRQPGTMFLGLTRNPSRENSYKWVGPIASRRVCAFRLKSRPDLSLDTPEDFKKYRFGTGLGFAAIQDLKAHGVSLNRIDEIRQDSVNIVKLFRKRIEFYASIDFTAAHNAHLEGYAWDQIECAYVLNDKYKLYFAFNRQTPDELTRSFQKALDTVKEKGKWQKLVNLYTGR